MTGHRLSDPLFDEDGRVRVSCSCGFHTKFSTNPERILQSVQDHLSDKSGGTRYRGSSPTPSFRLGCEKDRHPTRQAARRAAQMAEPDDRRGKTWRIYRCESCGGAWHWGHIPGARRRR